MAAQPFRRGKHGRWDGAVSAAEAGAQGHANVAKANADRYSCPGDAYFGSPAGHADAVSPDGLSFAKSW
jgi:hypothetical protein